VAHKPGGIGKVASKAGGTNVDSCSQILPLFTAIADPPKEKFWVLGYGKKVLGVEFWVLSEWKRISFGFFCFKPCAITFIFNFLSAFFGN